MEVDLALTEAAVFICGEIMIVVALIGFIVIAGAINQTLEGDN